MAIQIGVAFLPRTSGITSALQVFINVYHVTPMFVRLIDEASVTIIFVFYFHDLIILQKIVRLERQLIPYCMFVLFLYCLHLSSCTKYCTNVQILRKAASENIQHYSNENIHFT